MPPFVVARRLTFKVPDTISLAFYVFVKQDLLPRRGPAWRHMDDPSNLGKIENPNSHIVPVRPYCKPDSSNLHSNVAFADLFFYESLNALL